MRVGTKISDDDRRRAEIYARQFEADDAAGESPSLAELARRNQKRKRKSGSDHLDRTTDRGSDCRP